MWEYSWRFCVKGENSLLSGYSVIICVCYILWNAYRILVGNPERKRPLGRTRRRGMDNTKMDLRDTEWMMCIGLIWLRIGTRVLNIPIKWYRGYLHRRKTAKA
jgi:hypothetical protein